MVQMTISLTSMNANKFLMSVQGFKEFSSDEQVMTSDHNSSELGIHDHINELSSSQLVPKVVPPADMTATSRQELELLFHHHITMLRTGGIYHGHSIVRNSCLRYVGVEWVKGRMPTKIELTLEQSQQGVSNDVLYSNDDWKILPVSSSNSTAVGYIKMEMVCLIPADFGIHYHHAHAQLQ
ncbi:hypothetical protein Tco_0134744 [Tanacetum coccineum]